MSTFDDLQGDMPELDEKLVDALLDGRLDDADVPLSSIEVAQLISSAQGAPAAMELASEAAIVAGMSDTIRSNERARTRGRTATHVVQRAVAAKVVAIVAVGAFGLAAAAATGVVGSLVRGSPPADDVRTPGELESVPDPRESDDAITTSTVSAEGAVPTDPGASGQDVPPPDPKRAPPALTSTPPRQDVTPPSQEPVPPGQGAVPPGQEAVPPGQEATPPGQQAVPPGQQATPPGQEQTPPGQASTPPGQQQTPPGQASTPPGQQQTPPGQASTPPGQQQTPPGEEHTQPGQEHTPPGQEGKPLGHDATS